VIETATTLAIALAAGGPVAMLLVLLAVYLLMRTRPGVKIRLGLL
jgi:hypothetical protein